MKEVLETANGYESDTTEAVTVANGGEKTITNTYTAEPPATITITGRKVWADDSDALGLRPAAVTVRLLANGAVQPDAPVWGDKTGDEWTYTFADLPEFDANGERITYTVKEDPVAHYETAVDGTTITNTLVPPAQPNYTDIAGVKTWADNDNAAGKRPAYITVRLLRDGEVIDQRTVTAATEWKYDFGSLPVDDGYGRAYAYTVREDAVNGYFTRVEGYNITNTILPEKPRTEQPPFQEKPEEELEKAVDLPDYETPLWGTLLSTGETHPAYPYVFAGVGTLAAALWILLGRKRKEREDK